MIELEEPIDKPEVKPEPQENKRDYHTETIPEGYSVLDNLPSKTIPYDINALFVRPLFMGEIEQLSDMTQFSLPKFLSIIKDVVKGVDIKNLAVLDLKVALIYSLILSEDAQGWTLENTCEYCGTKFSHRLKVQELEFEDFPLDELPIKSTMKQIEDWDFDLLRMHHLLEVNAFLDKKSQDEELNAKLLMLAFASNQKDKEEAYNFLYRLPASTEIRDEINRLYGLILQSIKPIHVTCPNPELYVTLGNSKDVTRLLSEFKSVSFLNEKAYLPTDPQLRKEILDFLKSNGIKYTTHKCGHEQLRQVSLDFSHLYP